MNLEVEMLPLEQSEGDKRGRQRHALAARKSGQTYVAVFADEWYAQRALVEARLTYLAGQCQERTGARECQLVQPENSVTRMFLRANHMLGPGRWRIAYGLAKDGVLVSVMTFGGTSLAKGRSAHEWELDRFAVRADLSIPGAAQRLFSAFVGVHNPESVVSYADIRWSEGRLYDKLGFSFLHTTQPNYWYFDKTLPPVERRRLHRFNFRKSLLSKVLGSRFDSGLTEHENMRNSQYGWVYDCGNLAFAWRRGTTAESKRINSPA